MMRFRMHPTQVNSAAMMLLRGSNAFVVTVPHQQQRAAGHCFSSKNNSSSGSCPSVTFQRVPNDYLTKFVDAATASSSPGSGVPQSIDCYLDCLCTVDGIEYAIGVPSYYPVALCYYNEPPFSPIPYNRTTRDVFSSADDTLYEDFYYGKGYQLEYNLESPRQSSTFRELDEQYDDQMEVDFLQPFDYRGNKYQLMCQRGPDLVFGKFLEIVEGEYTKKWCVLLTPEESAQVMPVLEPFLQFGRLRQARYRQP